MGITGSFRTEDRCKVLRFCIDERELNSTTVEGTYALPKMDECIDEFGDAEYFRKLDAYSEYWQIEISLQYVPKTSFECNSGTLQCTRMPFGLMNVRNCFQRALDLILTKYKIKG